MMIMINVEYDIVIYESLTRPDCSHLDRARGFWQRHLRQNKVLAGFRHKKMYSNPPALIGEENLIWSGTILSRDVTTTGAGDVFPHLGQELS